MPASFIAHDGLVDIDLKWLNIPQGKAIEIISNNALYDWRRGLGPTVVVDGETVQKPWETLTNQEKLVMTFQAAQRLIIAQAHTAYVDTQQIAARDAAIEYADGEYNLG